MGCDEKIGDIRDVTKEEHELALEEYKLLFPSVTFPGKIAGGWVNGIRGWHVRAPQPGRVSTLDIEIVPERMVQHHNSGMGSVAEHYRKTCLHACPGCFNEQEGIYGSENRLMGFEELKAIILGIKRSHPLESVKFLGPGELLINPDLFKILDFFKEQGIHIGIFTKGVLLGHDGLAMKLFGMTSKELVERLATYENVSLLFSFQSFHRGQQDDYLTTPIKDKDGNALVNARGEQVRMGMPNYSKYRDAALGNILDSGFYNDGKTDRVCIINAPITPENVDQSFDIYKFWVERGTPIVMTPTMVSGHGLSLEEKQKRERLWVEKLVRLYSEVYAWNIEKGVQSAEQVAREGVASYVGAEPCNQTSTGVFIRANFNVELCPGRQVVYGNLLERPFEEIWEGSPNRAMAESEPDTLMNNRCPAKDGRVFPKGFYGRVLGRVISILEERGIRGDADTIRGVMAHKKQERMERMAELKSGAPSAKDAVRASVTKSAAVTGRMPMKNPPTRTQ